MNPVLVTILTTVAASVLTAILVSLGHWIADRGHTHASLPSQVNDLSAQMAHMTKLMNRLIEKDDEYGKELASVREAQHVAMRQQLSHNAEKYLRRAWITSEERQSWWEMYVSYSDMGNNGFMDAYWQRLEDLPIRSLDEMVGKADT